MRKPITHSIWLMLLLSVLSSSVSAGRLGDLTYEIADGQVTITDCDEAAEGELIIPDEIEGLPVTSIGGSAFFKCDSLTSITISEGVTSIGNQAFHNCRSLTSVTIPDSVTSIGIWAFYECNGLTSIVIPDIVTSIGDKAFYRCRSLTSITILEGATSIGVEAFHNCSSLTSITIPDSVTSIGYNAFRNCNSLTRVTIGNGVTSIGGRAFNECNGLTAITIGDSVTSIGGSAFYNCGSLTSIRIGDGVTSIGDYAFSFCNSLTAITIPKVFHSQSEASRLRLGHLWSDGFFSPFGDLTYRIADGQVRITDCKTSAKGDLIIPTEIQGLPVTSIWNEAFNNCQSLTSITVPDSVTSIGDRAFSECFKLTSVIIPDSVTSIGDRAFLNCNALNYGRLPEVFLIPAEVSRLWLPSRWAAYSSAKATAVLTNGFVVGAEITDGGANYGEIPVVTITGGGGTGAEAVAVLTDGRVTSIEMINAGRGYTSEPTITIEPPIVPPTQVSLRMVPAITITGDVRFSKTIEVADNADGPWTEWRTVVIGEDGTTEVDLDEGAEKRFYRVRD